MSSKITNILYWGSTVLFAAAMLSSGIMGMQSTPDNQAAMHQLGYPMYLGTILGVAKILGAGALVLPVGRTLKEWAYAGFVIDLVGASASWAFSGASLGVVLAPGLFLVVLLASYYLWRKRLTQSVESAYNSLAISN
ncbi:DoxX family protein [Hymenobacter volaticus]|uniref:DoxX family protein n=1 Tax=Hymenobacter volaticus TaxID=2932254 RepID=A0ABY4GFS6_9BACT|nr:DoxX family protein [Hymenobacter volaticus]UOQ69823.1 DoxX family protein [Hymenobacter volaticus]